MSILKPFHAELDLPRLLGGTVTEQLKDVLARAPALLQRFLRAAMPAMAKQDAAVENSPAAQALEEIGTFLGGQAGIVVSFLTTFRNLADPAAPQAIRDAYVAYFFSKSGYVTVDGSAIVAPIHIGDLDLTMLSGGKGKSLLGPATGERYVRDLVRLLVEAGDDVRYTVNGRRLPARLAALKTVAEAKGVADKLTMWLKGVSALAESQAMGAVEQATLGVAQFQTNPILAAAAGTFAGTAARKAAQHLFLCELGG
jgi:hypothetical protein